MNTLQISELVGNAPYTPLYEFKKVGVYILYNKGKIVYIGKSTNLFSRITSHLSTKEFEGYRFIECDEETLGGLEITLIKHYKPQLNKQFNDEAVLPVKTVPTSTCRATWRKKKKMEIRELALKIKTIEDCNVVLVKMKRLNALIENSQYNYFKRLHKALESASIEIKPDITTKFIQSVKDYSLRILPAN